MWSFGAILAELYTGYPLFPGKCYRDGVNAAVKHGSLSPLATSIPRESNERTGRV